MVKLNGMEVNSNPPNYFSLWEDGCRFTGGVTLNKVFNYGVRTGQAELTGGAKMIMFGQLTKWSDT